jgi:hypothetical protein
MRNLLLSLALSVPTICQAVGPEDSFFVAVASNGKETTLGYIFEEEAWSRDNIYGSRERKEFAYCWETETHFMCATKRGEVPKVRYVRGPNTGGTYKKARATFARAPSAKDFPIFFSYFECESGCEKLPVFIFNLVVYEP